MAGDRGERPWPVITFIDQLAGSQRGMWWEQGSEGWDIGSQPRDQGPQSMGLESLFFFFLWFGLVFEGSGIRAVPFLCE